MFVRDAALPLPRLHRPLARSSPTKANSNPITPHTISTFFPIVGLILYLVWKDQKPRCAHAIGKWALIGFIANTILIIIGIVFSLLLYSVAAPSYYDFGSYNDIVYGISMAIRMIAR